MVPNYFSDTKTFIIYPQNQISPCHINRTIVYNILSGGPIADLSINGGNSVSRLLDFGTKD